jgi:hypothetical protein
VVSLFVESVGSTGGSGRASSSPSPILTGIGDHSRIRCSIHASMYWFRSVMIWWGSKPCRITVGTSSRCKRDCQRAGETLSGHLRWVDGCTKALCIYIPEFVSSSQIGPIGKSKDTSESSALTTVALQLHLMLPPSPQSAMIPAVHSTLY